MGERRRAREFALQMLFQIDLTRADPDETIRHFSAARPAPPAAHEYAERLVRGTVAHRSRIDRLIADAAEHWRLERMGGVDRSLLRLAVYEFLEEPQVPRVVAIDEAVELAKRYGGADSGPFVNGILDAIRLRLEADRPIQDPRSEPEPS